MYWDIDRSPATRRNLKKIVQLLPAMLLIAWPLIRSLF
jgi:hypothetical protein